MSSSLLSSSGRLVKRTRLAALVAMALVLPAAHAHAQEFCQEVEGRYVESAVSTNCVSPVGLCIAGEYSGAIRGSFEGAATSLVPTADTPTTGVVLFTSDSTIHARYAGKKGDLIIKNAGAFRTSGGGDIVDMQVIIGGTQELSGASGVLRTNGTFRAGSGQSEYVGNVCLPG